MTDIAILTPDPAEASYTGLWQIVLARLQATLEGDGITVMPTPWTRHVDDASGLRGIRLVLPLLAWGYHRDHARWQQACTLWARERLPIANPAQVLAWNADKRYLATLQARGVPIPATHWTEQVDAVALEAAFAATGAEELIVKPAISAGAWKTQRVRRGEAVEERAGATMLIQPYLPTIETEGETSLLFFGGQLSHVVNKRPVPGEFRVQEEFGGRYRLLSPPPDAALALAGQVLAAIDEPLLYARIDVVPDADGRWLLMEAELIEPDFYLGVDPAQGALFSRAVRAALARGE